MNIRVLLPYWKLASIECSLLGFTARRSSKWSALSPWSPRRIEMQFQHCATARHYV
jgi:hypothetical protein